MSKENNKLIAEFMGMANERHSDGRYLFTTDIDELKGADTRFWEELYFHVSWDWLMPVVEKIESDERYDVEILQYGTRILDNQKEIVNNIANISFDKKINHTYQAVVEFINEYNN